MASGENDYAFGRLFPVLSLLDLTDDLLTSLGKSTNKRLHKCMFLGKESPRTKGLFITLQEDKEGRSYN